MNKRRVMVNLLIFIFVLEAVFYKGSLFLSAAVSEGQNMVRVGLVKEYLNKYGLDKETLLNLGKETRYFRDYLPKRDEIQDGEDENN